MIMVAMRHPVKDFDTWKSTYDTFPPTASGALFARVNRSVEDPNVILVVAGFEALETAQSFLSNPDLKAKMQEAGVTESPRIELYEQVEEV